MCDNHSGNNWSNGNTKKKCLKKSLDIILGKYSIDSLQKTVILVTAHIIWKILMFET